MAEYGVALCNFDGSNATNDGFATLLFELYFRSGKMMNNALVFYNTHKYVSVCRVVSTTLYSVRNSVFSVFVLYTMLTEIFNESILEESNFQRSPSLYQYSKIIPDDWKSVSVIKNLNQ